MTRNLFLIGAFLLCLQGMGATYHVSPNGNDNNSGTSPAQAWRTIQRADQVSFQAGDQLLFERGGVYRGTLNIYQNGTASNPITVGAYGTGAKPVISGSEVITGWEQWQGNIWRAQVGDAMPYVFVNGELMTLARYPNQGWLRVNSGTPTSLTDTDLTQPNGYWTGARAVIRTTNWSYDVAEITGHNGSTITHSSTGNPLQNYHWGYFLCNKLSELDMAGEWFYDEPQGYLYLWAPGNANPNTLIVEVATHDRGIYIAWERQHVKINDLVFTHQTEAGLRFAGTNHIEVQGCEFRQLRQSMLSTGHNMDLHDCLIEHTYATGMLLMGSNNLVRNNEFRDIALVPGLGENDWGYHGIRTNGPDNIIRENRFDNIGYIGILFDGNGIVERNYVARTLAILNDGGGIAFDHSNGAIIRNNIVTDLIGEFTSSATNYWSSYPLSMGIYFGNSNIQNALVEGNTVAHSTNIGIYVDHTMNSQGNVVTGNVLYNNGSGGGTPHRRGSQVRFSDHSNVDGQNAVAPYFMPYYDNVFTNNVLASLSPVQDGLAFYQIHTSAFTNYGNAFDNNVYFTPYNEQSIVNWDHFGGMIPHRHTLAHWQDAENKDLNSTTTDLRLSPWTKTNVVGPELVPNGTFDSNINGWIFQVGQGTLSNPSGVLDGACLRVQFNSTNSDQRLLIDHQSTFNYTQGEFYELKFTTISDDHVDLYVGVKGTDQGWAPEQLTFETYVGVGPERSEHSLIFQAPSSGSGRVFFRNRLDQPVYHLDNVSLRRVEVEFDDPLERIILVYNDQLTTQSIPLDGCFQDVYGNEVDGSVTLAPFTSVVLVRDDDPLCGITTSVDEADPLFSDMMVYPNPVRAGERLRLDLPASVRPAIIELFDMSGQLVPMPMEGSFQSGLTLPAGLANGPYVLRVTDMDGQLKHARVLVTR